jgi:RNA polymerase primary sigma factor
VQDLLKTLSPLESHIIRHRFGIDTEEGETLKTIATHYNLSRERIRQYQERSLDKLRFRIAEKEDYNRRAKAISCEKR